MEAMPEREFCSAIAPPFDSPAAEPSSSMGFDFKRKSNPGRPNDERSIDRKPFEAKQWEAAAGRDCGCCPGRARHADCRSRIMEQAQGTDRCDGSLQHHR